MRRRQSPRWTMLFLIPLCAWAPGLTAAGIEGVTDAELAGSPLPDYPYFQ